MEAPSEVYDAAPIFDNFDVDLLVKVLSHTAFSKLSSYLQRTLNDRDSQVHSLPSSFRCSTTSRVPAGRTLSSSSAPRTP